MRKRNPVWFILIFVLLLVLLIGGFLYWQWVRSQSIQVTPQGDVSTYHDCTEEIQAVLASYPTTAPDIPRITDVDTIRQVVALNFEGSCSPRVRKPSLTFCSSTATPPPSSSPPRS